MPKKHHSEDYKIAAVTHFLNTNNTSYTKTCNIFNCSRRSLKRWVDKYNETRSITRNVRTPIAYKITQNQVEYAIKLL